MQTTNSESKYTDVVVRKMKLTDLNEVTAIERAIFSMPWTYDSFASALEVEGSNYLVVESPEGKVVGYCGYYSSFDEAEITNVAVSPDARRKGYGSCMLEELLKQARTDRIARVILEVRFFNESAISLYKKMGFKEIGIRKGFYEKPREDAVIMLLEL